jgi:hypothetical protein
MQGLRWKWNYLRMKTYPLDKPYSEMTRREKRAYKRWLKKNGYWDGAEVIERLSKEKILNIRDL